MNGSLCLFFVADYKQGQGGGATRGWAIFGVISCMYKNSLIFCLSLVMPTKRTKTYK